MKVCDLEYKRVDVNKVIAAYEAAVKNIEAAKSAEGVLTARRELLEIVEDFIDRKFAVLRSLVVQHKGRILQAGKRVLRAKLPLAFRTAHSVYQGDAEHALQSGGIGGFACTRLQVVRGRTQNA